MERDQNMDKTGAQTVSKRRYVKPELVEHGDVREFTRGPGGSKNDTKGGGHS